MRGYFNRLTIYSKMFIVYKEFVIELQKYKTCLHTFTAFRVKNNFRIGNGSENDIRNSNKRWARKKKIHRSNGLFKTLRLISWIWIENSILILIIANWERKCRTKFKTCWKNDQNIYYGNSNNIPYQCSKMYWNTYSHD